MPSDDEREHHRVVVQQAAETPQPREPENAPVCRHSFCALLMLEQVLKLNHKTHVTVHDTFRYALQSLVVLTR